MNVPRTVRLYLDENHLLAADATVVAAHDDALAFDRSPFYPGGGGQPADVGQVTLADGPDLRVVTAQADADGVIWHATEPPPPPDSVGRRARLTVDGSRRLALTRYHTVLHVVNTIALRDYGARITGVQIGEDSSRIDFKWEGFSPAVVAEVEAKVNAVLAENRALTAYTISEAEFRQRDDLRRTLTAEPPVVDGRVRVVEIVGFDAQACGGTHVATTAEVGHFRITRTDNKGRINKRLYVRLDD